MTGTNQMMYRYCYRSLSEGFTDVELCQVGDVIQIPDQMGLFEVLSCGNEGDVYIHNGEWGAHPWMVVARTLDKNGLSDPNGAIARFCQEIKTETVVPDNIKLQNKVVFISRKGGNGRKRAQDIFKEVENEVLAKESDDLVNLFAREHEIRKTWLSRIADEPRNKIVVEILEEPLSEEKFGNHYVMVNGFAVLIDLMTDEVMSDEAAVEALKKQLPEDSELTRQAVKAGVIARLKGLQAKLQGIKEDV